MSRPLRVVFLCILHLVVWHTASAAGPRRGVRIERSPEHAAEWLHAYAVPLTTALTPSELSPIVESTRRAKVIGLGDGSHGTREFFVVKHRLIAELLRENRLDLIAFEAPLPMARQMDAYVRGKATSPLPSQRDGTYWFWQSEEIAAFLEDVRRHNATVLEPVRIRGVDAWDASAISAQLLRDLQAVDLQLRADAASALTCFRDPASYWKQRSSYRAQCRSLMETIGLHLEPFADSAPAASAQARDTLRHLLQAESIWAALPADRMTRRDTAMAGNLIHLASGARRQIVFWAHNGHAGTTGYPDDPAIPSAGHHLRAGLGDSYFAIATTTRRGAFRGRFHDSIVPHPVPPAPEDSWESAFDLLHEEILYVPFRQVPDAEWLHSSRRLFVGYAGTPPGARHEIISLPLAFDAVIYFDVTAPSTAYLPERGGASGPTGADR